MLLCAALVLCGAGVATVMLETTDARVTDEVTTPTCGHLAAIIPRVPLAHGCEECLRRGDTWVHLRQCLSCGHVGCCDSSKNRHATKHFWSSQHPIVRSAEPGEDWRWCYVDEIAV